MNTSRVSITAATNYMAKFNLELALGVEILEELYHSIRGPGEKLELEK